VDSYNSFLTIQTVIHNSLYMESGKESLLK